nr:MAG TPA: hypothetical protein [Caudoviricetes sp.]
MTRCVVLGPHGTPAGLDRPVRAEAAQQKKVRNNLARQKVGVFVTVRFAPGNK